MCSFVKKIYRFLRWFETLEQFRSPWCDYNGLYMTHPGCTLPNKILIMLTDSRKSIISIKPYYDWKRSGCSTKSATQKYLDRHFWLKNLSHSHSSSTYYFQMIGQGPLAGQSKFFGRNYLPFNDGGTSLNIYNYEKLNRSLPKYMTVCIESCGTGDISFSIGGPYLLWSIHTDELITTKIVGESFFLVDMICQIDLALIQSTASTLSRIIMTPVQNALSFMYGWSHDILCSA